MSSPDELISLRYSSFRDFLESNAGSLSNEGMFIATERPRPVGSPVRFELTVGHDFMLFRGQGTVAWARDAATSRGGDPGMAIRFDEVANPGRRLLEKVVRKYEEEGVEPFALKGRATTPEPSAEEDGETTLEEFLRQDLTPGAAPEPAGDQEFLAAEPPDVEILEIEEAAPGDLASEQPPPEAIEPPIDEETPDEEVPDEGAPTLEDLMAEAAAESLAAAEPPPAGVDLPGFQEPPPMEYRSGLSAEELAGSQAVRDEERSSRRWLSILLLIVLVAAAAYFFRDRWIGLIPGAGGTGGQTPSSESEVEPDAPVDAAMPATGEEATSETGNEPGPAEETSDPGAGDAAPDESAATRQPTAPEAAFTGVDSITWRDDAGTTVVVVRGDGTVSEGSISSFRVDQGRPREVVEIAGAKRPYAGADVRIDGRRVLRIRTGYSTEGGGVLRLVADLTGPDIRLQGIVVDGPEILITLASTSTG